jgi:hypothetical protein
VVEAARRVTAMTKRLFRVFRVSVVLFAVMVLVWLAYRLAH